MFKVHVAGYKRGLTKAVKRALRRRAAVEPFVAAVAGIGDDLAEADADGFLDRRRLNTPQPVRTA